MIISDKDGNLILDSKIALFRYERTQAEVWTRVMGYHRPVSEFNPGKQSEHAERKHFKERNFAPLGR